MQLPVLCQAVASAGLVEDQSLVPKESARSPLRGALWRNTDPPAVSETTVHFLNCPLPLLKGPVFVAANLKESLLEPRINIMDKI